MKIKHHTKRANIFYCLKQYKTIFNNLSDMIIYTDNRLFIDDEIKLINTSHNTKVVSSSLTPATKEYITRTVTVLVIFYCLKIGCNNALK